METELQTPPAAIADTRSRLIEAACEIVVRDGYANLTLDAAAREAAVSKGGLLYHFPTKRALLEGMIDHRCERFQGEVQRYLEQDNGTGAGRWLRAMIRASCGPKHPQLEEGAAIFAVLANDHELLERVRERRHAFREQIIADGIDRTQAMLIMLAVDGLCFNRLLGGSSDEEAESLRADVVERLVEMSTPCSNAKANENGNGNGKS